MVCIFIKTSLVEGYNCAQRRQAQDWPSVVESQDSLDLNHILIQNPKLNRGKHLSKKPKNSMILSKKTKRNKNSKQRKKQQAVNMLCTCRKVQP